MARFIINLMDRLSLRYDAILCSMNMDQVPSLSVLRITASLSAGPLNTKAVWWRGYLAALNEWKGGWNQMFDLLPAASINPSIDSFNFEYEVDCYSADVEISSAVVAEIASQPDTFDEDQEADDSCWISRIESTDGVAEEYLNHGQVRKLLLTRIHSLKVAFEDQIPTWIFDWWGGYLQALHENRVLTSKDAECFGKLVPERAS